MNELSKHSELPLLTSIFTAFLCVLFGANAVAIKIGLTEIGTFTLAGIRFSIAVAAIAIWAKATGRPFKFKRGQFYPLLIVAVLFLIQFGMFHFGLSKTNASRGTLISNVQPFFVLFLAHYFIPGDTITPRKITGILMGFIGVALLFLEKKGITTDLRTGDLVVLGAVFLWASSAVYMKKIIAGFQVFHLVFYPMIFSIPFFFIAGFFWDGNMIGQVNIIVILALLFQSLVTTAFGFVAWDTMLQKYGAVALHSYVFIMPISGVALGALVLGETVATLNIILAFLFIVGGVIVVNIRPRKHIPSFITRGGF